MGSLALAAVLPRLREPSDACLALFAIPVPDDLFLLLQRFVVVVVVGVGIFLLAGGLGALALPLLPQAAQGSVVVLVVLIVCRFCTQSRSQVSPLRGRIGFKSLLIFCSVSMK